MLNSSWDSTLVQLIVVSHTVSLNQDKFLKLFRSTSESFVLFCRLALTHIRFPAQGLAPSDTQVPSLLYYDKKGVVRAAGAEVLAQDVIETALMGGWTKAEW